MRCRSCDEALTDYETTRKSLFTGEYINFCNDCFSSIKGDCLAFGNPTLMSEEDDCYNALGFDGELVDYEDYDKDDEY